MLNKITTCFFLLATLSIASAQDLQNNTSKFIEVTGFAEIEVKPDIILYDIGLQEYWKEEFEAGKDYKDYTTKITVDDIEKEVVADLQKLGITKEQLTITEGNNYSKIHGKTFMGTKTIQVRVGDFTKINELIQKLKTRGISYMRIAELKNKDLSPFKKQTQIAALKDAKTKAEILLTSVGRTAGEIISVVELNTNSSEGLSAEAVHALTTMSSATSNQSNTSNNNIVLNYKVKVCFEIK